MEDGRDKVDDILRVRITGLKLAREKAHAVLERARSATWAVADLGPIVIERFTRTTREKLTAGEIPFRKAYLASLVDRIEVDDREVRIAGRKEVLEREVLATTQGQSGVHSFEISGEPGRTKQRTPMCLQLLSEFGTGFDYRCLSKARILIAA